jgi:hypothetical protein
MRRPPALALWTLARFAPADEALVGDLLQEFAAGRSRAWVWRQVVTAVWLGALRDIAAHRTRTAAAVVTGWSVVFLLYGLVGDLTANGLARLLFDWDSDRAYAGDVPWWPFWITSSFVSYATFALAGFIVSRLNRAHPSLLLTYTVTIGLGVIVGGVVIETLTARWGMVPVPHILFYFVAVSLPHYWRAGIVLAPMVTVLGGLLASRSRDQRPQIVV